MSNVMFTLKPRRDFKVPVEAECITCDAFSEKSMDEIRSLLMWEGNKRRKLGELFKVEQKAGPDENGTEIRLVGDLSKVRKIGYSMTEGKMIIDGNVGSHLGEGMKGGSIIVYGNAGSWLGSAMKGGRIEVMGNAGDYVAAPYRGSIEGMKDGEIIIRGDAGNEAGCFMRGGLIRIKGNVSQFLGIHMRDGTILVLGGSKGRVGAEMVGGKIIVCGYVPEVLPTFTIDALRPSVKVTGQERVKGPFYRFVGDLAENGDGRLFISKTSNPHLSFYEEYL
ncbi:MAG: formylmethanofuran dehydrogenase subunit C [Candidatus Bathyarchaeia archaeon]